MVSEENVTRVVVELRVGGGEGEVQEVWRGKGGWWRWRGMLV